MTNQQMKTLANNGITTMIKFFDANPTHPAAAKFTNALDNGDMLTAFGVFQSFLTELEKLANDRNVSIDMVLNYWTNK